MNATKNIIVALALLLVPVMAFASIDANLYYGVRNTQQVKELQEFLVDKGYMTQATGNFYSITLKAVKKFQTDHNIVSTGYVGILTRTEVNAELAADLAGSDQASTEETGKVSPTPASQPVQPLPVVIVPSPDQQLPVVPTLSLTVTTYASQTNLALTVKEPFEYATLVVKDENGRTIRNSDIWSTDRDGFSRQVIDLAPDGQNHAYSYEVKARKAGFLDADAAGTFPGVQNN